MGEYASTPNLSWKFQTWCWRFPGNFHTGVTTTNVPATAVLPSASVQPVSCLAIAMYDHSENT